MDLTLQKEKKNIYNYRKTHKRIIYGIAKGFYFCFLPFDMLLIAINMLVRSPQAARNWPLYSRQMRKAKIKEFSTFKIVISSNNTL